MFLYVVSYMLGFSFILSEGLGEGFDGDLAFASALDTFGGDTSDPDFMALGGKPLIFLFYLISQPLYFFFFF